VGKNGFHFYQKFFNNEYNYYFYDHRKIKDKIYIQSTIDKRDNMEPCCKAMGCKLWRYGKNGI